MGQIMSDAVILALISAIAGPLVAAVIYMAKTAYSDNRESWRIRAESAESREQELKSELLPAVQELIGSVTALAEGREKDREFIRRVEPAIKRIDRIVADTLGEETAAEQQSETRAGKERHDEPA